MMIGTNCALNARDKYLKLKARTHRNLIREIQRYKIKISRLLHRFIINQHIRVKNKILDGLKQPAPLPDVANLQNSVAYADQPSMTYVKKSYFDLNLMSKKSMKNANEMYEGGALPHLM